MTSKVISKYIAIVALFAMSGCTYNQYTAANGADDDLYGGGREAVAVASNQSSGYTGNTNNPDYPISNPDSYEGTDEYYDENYLTARNIQRRSGGQVGYSDGFSDGYYAGKSAAFNRGFYNSMYPMYGYNRFSLGFSMGMGSMLGLGYNPFGWNSFGYDPFYSSYGWGSSMYGYGNPFYGGLGYYGGLGMYTGFYGSPFGGGYYRPTVINYFGESGNNGRNYGIRESVGAGSRNGVASGNMRNSGANSYNRSGVTNGRTSSNDTYYARPRGGASAVNSEARTNNGSGTTLRRSGATSGGEYYSTPSNTRSYNTTPNRSSSSRTSEGTYTAPQRSSNTYSAPSRSSSNTYSAPQRSSAPSYSAPARSSAPSYSAPSRSSSGGGSTSRGSR